MKSTSIETYTGQMIDVADPNPNKINLNDIAHALSNICRYSGHCKSFYSVAEHCVLGSFLIEEPLVKMFLLHDASEAYLNDLSRPLKTILPKYKSLEDVFSYVIYERFLGKQPTKEEKKKIKHVDDQMLLLEAHELMPSKGSGWSEKWTDHAGIPRRVSIQNWNPGTAKRKYEKRIQEVYDGNGV